MSDKTDNGPYIFEGHDTWDAKRGDGHPVHLRMANVTYVGPDQARLVAYVFDDKDAELIVRALNLLIKTESKVRLVEVQD